MAKPSSDTTRLDISTAEFNRVIGNFCSKLLPEKANLAKQKIAMQVLTGVVRKSPVATGRFRGNWQVTLNAPAAASKLVSEKGGPHGTAPTSVTGPGRQVIQAAQWGQTIWISNNLIYAVPLENGWSQGQAPAGMVAITLAEIETQFI